MVLPLAYESGIDNYDVYVSVVDKFYNALFIEISSYILD